MQAQETSPVNQQYFTDLTQQINMIAADGLLPCAEIQALVNEAAASIQAELTAIRGQIAGLTPLTTIPTSLGGVISWITNFVKPILKAVATYEAQLTSLLQSVATLEAAITAAAKRCINCNITMPPIS